ncbi:hypothetical protein F4703DRAFT_1929909 [Phycomyces blakesleeanus]
MLLSFIILITLSIPPQRQPLVLSKLGKIAKASLPRFHSYSSLIANFLIRLGSYWTHALKQTSFSSSLPDTEETAFEEQFKYFIVTSSLLSDTPITQTTDLTPADTNDLPALKQSEKTYGVWKKIILISSVLSFLWVAGGMATSSFGSQPDTSYSHQLLIISVCIGHLIGYFIIRRSHRRTIIRRLHRTALVKLCQIVDLFQNSDTSLLRLLDSIRQVDLISQGYTLASACSAPRPLREQPNNKPRQITEICRETSELLHALFEPLATCITQLQPLTHQANLLRLREMYNVEELPKNFVDTADIRKSVMPTDRLDHISYAVRCRRRETLMYLLALDIMTSGHDSERDDYEQKWENAVNIMSNLISTYTEFNANINKLLDAAIFQDGLSREYDCGGRSFDPRAQTLLHRFNVLENYIRNIQSKIFLCKHDTKTFTSGRGSAYSIERIGERFGTIDQDFSHMLSQWEETKETLLGFTRQEISPRTSQLPSPPTSPRQTGIRSSGTIKRLSYIQQSRQKPSPVTRHSLMTAAAVASFLENKRVHRLQARQQIASEGIVNDYKDVPALPHSIRRPSTPISTHSTDDE